MDLRGFDLPRVPRGRSKVNEQTRASTITGRAEAGNYMRGGPAWDDDQRSVPGPRHADIERMGAVIAQITAGTTAVVMQFLEQA